jgi:hypothetical protein
MHDDIIDLYSVDHPKITKRTTMEEEVPFLHNIEILGPNGEINRVRALSNGGAMVGAMCTSIFHKVQHRMGNSEPSKRLLRMANGAIEPSKRWWEGPIRLGNVIVQGQFEVFNSGGGWGFLFGKPLLWLFNTIHNYDTDTVTVRDPNTKVTTVLYNQLHLPITEAADKQGISLTLDVKQWGDILGGSSAMKPPSREVIINLEIDSQNWNANEESIEPLDNSTQVHGVTTIDDDIYTRHTEPFKAECVKRILSQVTVRPDITLEQHSKVEELITEFADCFTLAMTEVNAVPGAVHKLNIPSNAKFRTKLMQHSLNPAQKAYLQVWNSSWTRRVYSASSKC